jgi:DNA-binding MarR family transcriptional regulator
VKVYCQPELTLFFIKSAFNKEKWKDYVKTLAFDVAIINCYLSIMPDDHPKRAIPFDNIRGLLQDLASALDERAVAYRKGTRYENVRLSDVKVFILASRKARTVSEIARELEVTRQAVHSSVLRLKALQVVELLPQPGNGRDKLVTVTEKGWQAQAVANDSITQLEKECAGILGTKGLEQFRKQLLALVTALKVRDAT